MSATLTKPLTSAPSSGPLKSSLVRSTLSSGAPSTRILLVWANSVALTFLLIGGMGLWNPSYQISLWLEQGNTAKDAQDETMGAAVEMQLEAPAEEVTPPDPVEQPPDPAPTPPIVPQDALPEPVEQVTPLTENAIFPVPELQPLVKPLALTEEKPKPTPKPRPATPRPAAAAPSTTPGPPAGNTGAAQGMRSGSSGSKGHFPAPSYPAFARSRGVQGGVSVAISVDASGTVISVRILSTSGSAELDQYVCDWVQRHWRWPAGQPDTYRQPVVFKLH